MNTICLTSHPEKVFKIGMFAFVMICLSFDMSAQSVIFKKDGTQISAEKVSRSNNIISYFLESDSTGVEYFISKNVVDSIRYLNGKVERFQAPVIYDDKKNQSTKLLKNSVGINVWPFFYSKINFYYERLFFQNKLGFKNYLLVDLEKNYPNYYGTINEMADFYYSAGLNYYFADSYFFRPGIGVSILTGKFNYEDWNNYNVVKVDEFKTGLLLTTSISIHVIEFADISLGLDFPIGFDLPEWYVMFRTEVSINF